MKKVTVDINQCKPGMQIAETIFNDYGAAIITEDTILDAHILEKLKNLNRKQRSGKVGF